MKKRRQTAIVAAWLIALLLGVELVSWMTSARESRHGYAWVSLVTEHLSNTPTRYLPTCVAVDPALYDRTPEGLRAALREELSQHGLNLEVRPPTLHPPTGYYYRECTEYFVDSDLRHCASVGFPVVSLAVVSYFGYDFQCDAVLMLQLGPRWLKLRTWSVVI